MRKAYRTPDELVQIYTLHKEGMTGKQIGQKLTLNYYSVLTALRLLERYLNGKLPREAKHFTNYQAAAKLIRKQRAASKLPAPSETPAPPDSFTFLKSSFDTFQQAVAVFIDTEFKRRNRALQEEIQALREENEQLKARQQTSISWIDTLERNFSKEDA